MRMSRQARSSSLAISILLCTCAGALAADDAARLGKDLTPSGAEVAGTKDGRIPAWSGTEAPLPGWSRGKNRGDFWKHRSEKPLFSIDASNVAKYEDKLTAGQIALIKAGKGYRMDVYPTHRTCSAPDFVLENTRKNPQVARISEDGWSLKEAVVPGFPFPFPKTGTEAMWNSKLRYHGEGIEYKNITTVVSPRKGSDTWIKPQMEFNYYFPLGVKGSALLSSLPQVESHGYISYTTPAALAGQAFAVTVYANQPSETFYYFPGQRRVRRMPSYAYDAPQIGYENQYTMDEVTVFYGPMDRFDWKLVGKKEIYVPYNVFGAYKLDARDAEAFQPDFLDPALRRYELHRVWVVEATVKAGVRHSTPKRTFYLDEDSWNLLAADDFDAQGKLAKTREGLLIPVYEIGSCDVMAFTQYNLLEGRYLVDFHSIGNGIGNDAYWVAEGSGPRYKSGFYTAENLRAISER